ncbi:hypothetical protein JCM3775_004239 [Rhodotorula graminis]|uniref:Uncharacterized protein n=1 Tax=Rhodotorula graminis (strain WP1) TaxID=578459 RepID=A0A194SBP1_RHOGW|nr:uncharacterized protein RHOBADRAFT_51810 [Rhodotorula graminis WP1]KPV76821.1 hypothetical protein RHOBADRAFT_51810 [Rhodotorula graminis WP1]
MTVPQAPLSISLDAPPVEQLAQLARLKRRVVGTRAAKQAVLSSGIANSLVALLQPRAGPDFEGCLAVSAEAANVLAALSIPTLDAVATLFSVDAHHAVSLSLPHILALVPASSPSPAQQKVVEAHLRALKSLFSDLVRVVGPREWGTEVMGASIDAAERRDAENLWAYSPGEDKQPQGPRPCGKGKGKETDSMQVDASGGRARLDVQQLQAAAARVLCDVYEPASGDEAPLAGSSSASSGSSGKGARSATLDAVLSLLVWSAQEDRHVFRIAELVCSFIAGTVRWPSQRAAVANDERGTAVLEALRSLIEKGSDKVRESALRALAVLIRDVPTLVVFFINYADGDSLQSRLHPLAPLVQSPSPTIRLAAATVCSIIAKTVHPRSSLLPAEFGSTLATALLGLIEKEPTLRSQAAFAFAYLVADDLALQKRAVAARCFQIFNEALKRPAILEHPYPTPALVEEDARLREGILLSIATVAALSEPHRRLVLDQRLLVHILFGLSYPSVGVRAAACHCVRALSRSVNVLRTDLVEAHAEEQLVRLLREDENEMVKITAAAAVANLLLDFSPMRPVLVDAGCIARMCQLVVKSTNPALQLNAMWALKNATYQSTAEFKRAVLVDLTWDHLATLIASPDASVVEPALSILRNITCVTNNEAITGLGAHEMGEERLLGLLQDRIAVGVAAGGRKGGENLVEQALFCLNNIATASESAQLAIASRTTLLRYVFSYLDSRLISLRVAALWVLHNLAYRARPTAFSPHAARRPHEIVDKLRAMGLDAKLRVLERDPELDVRERVRDLKEALL